MNVLPVIYSLSVLWVCRSLLNGGGLGLGPSPGMPLTALDEAYYYYGHRNPLDAQPGKFVWLFNTTLFSAIGCSFVVTAFDICKIQFFMSIIDSIDSVFDIDIVD